MECDDPTPKPILTRLNPDEEEELTWLWDPYVPDEFFFGIAGEEGSAKTLWLIDFISRITNGREMPNGGPACEPGCVILVTAEDHSSRMLTPRLKAAEVDFQRLRILDLITEAGQKSPLVLPRDTAVIAKAVDTIQQETGFPCRLIHFDPLIDRLDTRINENSYKDVRQGLSQISPLAEQLHCTFGATSHWNKQVAYRNKHRSMGSAGFLSAFRVAFSIYEHPEDPSIRVFHPEGSRLVEAALVPPLAFKVVGPTGRPRIEWLGLAELPEEVEASRIGDDRGACGEWLRKRLAGTLGVARAVLTREANKQGWSESTLRRAFKDIGGQSQPIPGSGNNQVLWFLDPTDEVTK